MKRDNETEDEAFERHSRFIEEVREELKERTTYGWVGFLFGMIGTLSVFLFLREYVASSIELVAGDYSNRMNLLLIMISISFVGMIYSLFKYFYPMYKQIQKRYK